MRPLGPPARRSWRSMTHARTKPCPASPPHSPPPLPLSSLPSLTRPTRKANFYGKTCSRALSQPCGISLALLPATPEAPRQMTVTATTNTRTHASAPRFRASSPRASTQAFARACCKCMRERDPGLHARALPSSATRMWRLNTRHGPTLQADECVDSVRFRLGCAGPMEPVTCAGHGRGARLLLRPGRSHTRPLSHTRPHNNAITPLRWRYLASSLART